MSRRLFGMPMTALSAALMLGHGPTLVWAQVAETPAFDSTDDFRNVSHLLRLSGTDVNGGHVARIDSAGSLTVLNPITAHQIGSAYHTNNIDISKGFTTRFRGGIFRNDFGFAFVIKDAAETRDIAPGINPNTGQMVVQRGRANAHGFVNLRYALSVVYLPVATDNGNQPTIEVYGPASGNSFNLLARVTIPASVFNGTDPRNFFGTFQIRYIPESQMLDVFMNNQLVTRLFNIVFDPGFFRSNNQAQMGFLCGAFERNNENVSCLRLLNWSIGNQLVFDDGIGPNFYRERFPFKTTKQSVFGPSANLTWKRELVKEWNESFHRSGFTGSGAFRFGGGLDMDTTGKLGLIFRANANGGLADIDYPLNLKMIFPDQNSVAPGQAFDLAASYDPDYTAKLTSASPTVNFIGEFVSRLKFKLNADAVLFGESLIGNNGKLLDIDIAERNIEFFNLDTIRNSDALPIIKTAIGITGFLQDTEGATGSAKSSTRGTRGRGSTGGIARNVNPMDFLSFSINFPNLSVNAPVGSDFNSPRVIQGSKRDTIATLDANFTSALLGLIGAPGEFIDFLRKQDISVDLGSNGSFSAGWAIADFYGRIAQELQVDYKFEPKVKVTLRIRELGGNTLAPVRYELSAITGKVIGNPPRLTMPANGRALEITPEIELDNAFTPTLQPRTNFGLYANPFQIYCKVTDGVSTIVDLDSGPAMGFPLGVNIRTPANGDPTTAAFRIGQETTNGAQPFTVLTGRPFLFYPTIARNPQISYAANSIRQVQQFAQNATGTTRVVFNVANADPNTARVRIGELNNRAFDRVPTFNANATQLTADIPNSLLTLPGAVRLTLINGATTSQEFPSNSLSLIVAAPAPGIASVQPNRIVLGQTPSVPVVTRDNRRFFELSVNGSNFQPNTNARWDGQPVPTRFVSSSRLVAEVPTDFLATAGTAQITVATPEPGGGVGGPVQVDTVNPLPLLSPNALSQTTSAPGVKSLTLIVSGGNFMPVSQILWNGELRPTNYLSANALSLDLSEADLAQSGINTVQVRTPGPGGGTTTSQNFLVAVPPVGRIALNLTPTLTRDEATGEVLVQLQIANKSGQDAEGFVLGFVGMRNVPGVSTPVSPTPNVLPLSLGTIAKGATVTPNVTLRFPASIGQKGRALILQITGSYNGGSFSQRQRILLP